MPSPLVCVVDRLPFSTSAMVTFAPAITACDASTTRPVIVAPVLCAVATAERSRQRKSKAAQPRMQGLLLGRFTAFLHVRRGLPTLYHRCSSSRVVRLRPEGREQELLTAWLLAAARRFDGYEDGVNLRQRLWIVEFQHPALVRFVVEIEDPHVERAFIGEPAPAPGLEYAGITQRRFLVQIERVENERLPFRIENAPEGLLLVTGAIHVINVGNVEIAGAHQFTHVAVLRQELLRLLM